jgi:hypothetical protein
VLRGMFIGMNAYTKKHAQISNKWPNAASQTPRKARKSQTQNEKEYDNKNMSRNQWNRDQEIHTNY